MAIDFNDNLQIRAPKPIDDRYGPWGTIEEGLINVPYPYRYDKLTLNIAGVEYWFKNGLEDVDLVIKEYGSGDTSKWETSTILTQSSVNFGRLYNWYAAVDTRNIAPIGWHVPSVEEFQELIDYCGGNSAAAIKLKSAGNSKWQYYEGRIGTDDFGFCAYPSGYIIGSSVDLGKATAFNTTYDGGAGVSSSLWLSFDIPYGGPIALSNKYAAAPIRCIKNDSNHVSSVVDVDWNVYDTVKIGNQVWLKQNLAVKHYQNGDLIGSDFSGTDGAVAAYNNDENNVYNFINGEDPIHIRPKLNKRIDASIIDNLPIESVISGTNVDINITDPKNPIINVPIIGTVLTSNQLQIINTVPLVCSDEKTDIVASLTESKIKFVFQTQQSFTNIVGELNVAAVGGTFTVDVTKNGTSILSTYLTFDSGETTTRTASIPKVLTTSSVSFNIGDYVEVFVRTVGALVPGKGLKIYLM